MYNAANNASSQLATSIGAEDTSLAVLDGSSFPEPPFVVSIEDEIIEVRAKNGNTFSALVRGTEGTTPASHASGSRVENRFTAGTYQQVVSELDAHKAENATDDVHGLLSGGKIIEESGNNANGYYVRFADGTQITKSKVTYDPPLAITTATGAIYRSSTANRTPAASFIDADYVVSISVKDSNAIWGTGRATTASNYVIGFLSGDNSKTVSEAIEIAIGRWK